MNEEHGEQGHAVAGWKVVLETVVITVGLPLLGWLIDHSDPFLLQRGFTWVAFAPLLVGLRYGSGPGLVSAAALDVAILGAWRAQMFGVSRIPYDLLVGLLALAILCGQLTDVQTRIIRRMRDTVTSVERRLEELGRAYFLLDLSHDRLTERQERPPPNLRAALSALHDVQREERTMEALAPRLLGILETYCNLEIGSLHAVENGVVDPRPMASVGKVHPISPDDPMIQLAVKRRRLVHVPQTASHDEPTALLLASPVYDVGGTVRAVVCVQTMPFTAFEKRNLDAISTLGGYAADLVAGTARRDRRGDFEIRLARAIYDLRKRNMPSTLARLTVGQGTPAEAALEVLMAGTLRPSDAAIRFRPKGGQIQVLALFPTVADAQAEKVVVERLEALAHAECGTTLEQAGARIELVPFAPTDEPNVIVKRLVEAS